MIRTLVAVLAGYLVFGISAGLLFNVTRHNPKVWPGAGFAILATVYGMVFAYLGGWVASAIANRNPGRHAWMVTATIVTIAILSMILQASSASIWSEVAAVVFMAPAAGLASRRISR